jgi:hypothetical protein
MPESASEPEKFEELRRRVQSLRAAVYAQPDPAAHPDFARLIEAEARLHKREAELRAAEPPPAPAAEKAATPAARGRLLGPLTTNLRVETKLHMQPLPTGIYHLLDPVTDPLFTVTVYNDARCARRVRVTAFLEGLSARAVRTAEIKDRDKAAFPLSPTLLPERARGVTEVQWATLHVKVDILGTQRDDGKSTPTVCESHNTFPVACLARTSSFNSVRRPETGERVDLSHYYGAWVTPHVEPVQERVRRAADLSGSGSIWGYQQNAASVTKQVAALYQALKEAGLTYVNSVIDYGAAAGQATQRTRLPREALTTRSANCIDGTMLMASLLEAASLNAAIALIPGHAFVGWQTWDEDGAEWRFLETTLVGQADFETACKSGQRQYQQFTDYYPDRVKCHKLPELRARNIWPME